MIRSEQRKRRTGKYIYNRGTKKYLLDNLGIANNLVMGMSYYRLTNKHKGYCVKVVRGNDFAEMNIGFVAGYIDYLSIANFCGAAEGRVSINYNQSILSGGNNAIQSLWAKMPTIFDGSNFSTNGIIFINARNTYMTVNQYAEINISEPPLSIYANINISSNSNGFIWNKTNGYDAYMFYSAPTLFNTWRLNNAERISRGQTLGINQKILYAWITKNSGDAKITIDGVTSSGTYNASLSHTSNLLIGGQSGANWINGNIKSLLIFNSNQSSNYNNFVNGGL